VAKGDSSEVARKRLIEFVRQFAEFAGVSQIEIAERCGMQQPNVNRFLTGRDSPRLDTFLKIAVVLDLNIEIVSRREKK